MRSGILKSNLDTKYPYKYFLPTRLGDIKINYNDKMVKLLESTYKNIEEYHKMINLYPEEKKLLIKEKLLKEEASFSAILSNGSNLNEINLNDALVNEDIDNLNNIFKNLKTYLKDIPLSKRLFKIIHKEIMKGTLYEKKYPGEFRYTPAWIGFNGSNINNAFLVFPTSSDMLNLLSDLENFIHYNFDVPNLIKAILVHYQFEVIHPFIDGNGRVGRLLYLELLKELNILNLYIPISKTLHKHSTMYYKSFEIVEKEGNYEEFIIFHLNSLCECLNDVKKNIENLYL